MRVSLTGHQGYFGSMLTKMLLQADHEVFDLDSDLFVRGCFVGELADLTGLWKNLREVELGGPQGFANREMLDEYATFNPVVPYAESKVFPEGELINLANPEFAQVFLHNTTLLERSFKSVSDQTPKKGMLKACTVEKCSYSNRIFSHFCTRETRSR